MNPLQVRDKIKDMTGVTITKTVFRDAVAPAIGVAKSKLNDDFDLGNERDVVFYVNCIIDRGPRDVSNALTAWYDVNAPEASAAGQPINDVTVAGDEGQEQTDAESDLDADAPEPAAQPERPAARTKQSGPRPTKVDLELARVLDATQARLRDIPAGAWVQRRFPDGTPVMLYRPAVEVDNFRIGGKRELCYVYDSLDPTDGRIAVTAADYERYQSGDWALRHMPLVTSGYWEGLLKILKGFSTYTHTCSVGGERFDPLLKSKARMFLRKQRGGPFSSGSLEPMLFPRRCYVHYVLEETSREIQRSWMQATVDLQHLRGDAEELQKARADRMEELIREVYETVRKRNRRISLAGVAQAFVAYAESLNPTSGPKE